MAKQINFGNTMADVQTLMLQPLHQIRKMSTRMVDPQLGITRVKSGGVTGGLSVSPVRHGPPVSNLQPPDCGAPTAAIAQIPLPLPGGVAPSATTGAPLPKEPVGRPGTSGGQSVPGLRVRAVVEHNSPTNRRWLAGTVVALNKDGTYVVTVVKRKDRIETKNPVVIGDAPGDIRPLRGWGR